MWSFGGCWWLFGGFLVVVLCLFLKWFVSGVSGFILLFGRELPQQYLLRNDDWPP